jgi:hypothetical protein
MAKEKRVTLKDGGASVRVGKDVDLYVKPGGKPASRHLPKGEKRVEAGVRLRFGGKKKKQ